MDQELIAYLDKRFGETAQQIQGLREETTQQIQGLWEETTQQIQGLQKETTQQIQGLREEMKESIRHTQILIEDTRGEIRIVAEGFVGQSESLDGFRKEMKQELNDIRQLIRPAYSSLDQRLRKLEVHVDLRTTDPIKYIKERILGRPPE